MPVLTDKQRDQLNQALQEYFVAHNFENTAEAFSAELSDRAARSFASTDTVLEKKWVTNLRLQSKVLELEKHIKQLQQELEEVHDPNPAKKSKVKDALPVSPAKFTLEGHRDAVHAVAFHPNYSVVVSCGEDATTRIWDYETGEQEKVLRGHTNQITWVSFDDDGKVLATCSQDLAIKLWDFQTGECLKTLQGHEHTVSCIDFYPGADTAISCSRDYTVRVWDISLGTCKKVLRGHEDWVRVCVVSADGSYIASGGHDQTVRIWDGRSFKCIHTLRDFSNAVECLAFSNAAANQIVREAYKVADPFSRGIESKIESTDDTPAENNNHTTTNSEEEPSQNSTTPKIISKSGKDLTAALAAAKAKAAEKRAAKENHQKEQVQNTPQFLIGGARDKLIKMWDILTGATVLTLTGHDDWVRGLAFHSNGKWILSSSDDRTIRMWDIAEGRCRRKIDEAHDHFITCLALHPTGKPVCATGSVDKNVKIWMCK